MAKSKWPEVKEKLILVAAWCRDGLTEDQIAKNLGISIQTFYTYKKEHIEFFEVLKKNKEFADIEVENSLYKRAMGYKYDEVTCETYFDEKEQAYKQKETKRVTKEVHPDTTAQIFWLKNRKPKEWRDKQEVQHSGNVGVTIVDDV